MGQSPRQPGRSVQCLHPAEVPLPLRPPHLPGQGADGEAEQHDLASGQGQQRLQHGQDQDTEGEALQRVDGDDD